METRSVEERIDEVEQEYKRGLLTKKGYEFKTSLLVLEKELEEGDITAKGFEKKKKQLLDKNEATSAKSLTSLSSELTPPTDQCIASSSISNLKGSAVHSTLAKLFNKKTPQQNHGKGKGRASQKKHTDDDKDAVTQENHISKVKKFKKEKEVAVTVVMVDNDAISIPRHNKAQLKSKNQMKLCNIFPSDGNESIVLKLQEIFQQKMKILRATRSGDLFDLEEKLNGEDLLDLIGLGCLYVKPCNVPPNLKACEETPIAPEKPLKGDVNWGCLKLELQDNCTIHSYKMDSESYVPDPDQDDELCANAERSDGETFLCRNNCVDVWIDILRATNNNIPRSVHHFYIASEQQMLSYDRFRDEFRKTSIKDKCVRKNNEIMKLWIAEKKVKCGQTIIGGMQYLLIDYEDMDGLCEFVNQAQRKYC